MKRYLSFVLFLILGLSLSLRAEQLSPRAQELFVKMRQAMADDEYSKALQYSEQTLAAIQAQQEPTDSLQVELITYQGVIYRNLKQYQRAIDRAKQGVAKLESLHRDSTRQMANLCDNIALYYTSINDYAHATVYSKRALDIYYTLRTNDMDMGISLMRAAEVASYSNRAEDAVLYQTQALNIFEQVKGRHSSLYMDETEYLSKYLANVGRTDEAKQCDELVKQLRHENKVGYLPMPADLSTPDKCRMHREDAFYASLYYLSHYFTGDSMIYVFNYLRNFSFNSKDVMVFVGVPEVEWMQDTLATGYFGSYLAACIRYQLSTADTTLSQEFYCNVYDHLLTHYGHNRQFTGEIKALEALYALREKKPEKYAKRIEKNFTTLVEDRKKMAKQ